MKYSKSLLEPIVKNSKSTSEVMRKLGLSLSGGTNSHLNRLFKKFDIDISHFTGRYHNKGKTDPKKIQWKDVLVFDRLKGRRENLFRLKRALIESGVLEQCVLCPTKTEWNGKAITLQIDHIDGNCINNLPHNLRFLCPNCHSQTPTFGIKNRKPMSLYDKVRKDIQRQCDNEVIAELFKLTNI